MARRVLRQRDKVPCTRNIRDPRRSPQGREEGPEIPTRKAQAPQRRHTNLHQLFPRAYEHVEGLSGATHMERLLEFARTEVFDSGKGVLGSDLRPQRFVMVVDRR